MIIDNNRTDINQRILDSGITQVEDNVDENEREQVATIQQITDDYKEQVKQYRALAESTGKNSYNMLADNIESRGIAKDSIEPIKQNLMQENNPYKIREYLRQNGEELDKYFPRASAQLNRKADQLEAGYKVSDKEVLDSEVYKMQVEQINREMRNTDGTLRDGYTLEQYGRNMNQAKMNAEITLEATAAPPGVAPVSEEDISMIWDNPEARDAWLTNPLDDINEIKKKYGMVETEEDDLDDDGSEIPPPDPSIVELESKVKAFEEAGLTELSGYEEAKKELRLKEAEKNRKDIDNKIKELSQKTGAPEEEIRKDMLRKTRGKLYTLSPGLAFITDQIGKSIKK